MKCADNCGYWYQGEDENYPSCHFDSNELWPAPCECEEDYDE